MDTQAQAERQRRQNEGPKRPPLYELGKEGHFEFRYPAGLHRVLNKVADNCGLLGACQQLANQGQAPDPEIYTGPWQNINQGLHGPYREILSAYWQGSLRRLEDDEHDYKSQQLPIARIKKVMKADPEVKMISAEAPILFAKGCEVFITELTMRAWIHAEENKRRTLQRSDIAAALTKSDMFDFLIDIVPREESAGSHSRRPPQNPPVPPPQIPQQSAMPPQVPPQHHPSHEYAPYMSAEQDYRAPPMYATQVGADTGAYGHPQAPMFDPNMYTGYPMAPQQMYQMPPQRPQESQGGPDPGHHYRPHEGGGGVDADAEGERDYDVN